MQHPPQGHGCARIAQWRKVAGAAGAIEGVANPAEGVRSGQAIACGKKRL
jgi:hypothetical protein